MKSRQVKVVIGFLLLPMSMPLAAQIVSRNGPLDLTLEGYANLTAATEGSIELPDQANSDPLQIDAALRGLARWKNADGPDLGLRVVVETSSQDHAKVAEASLLAFGHAGRLEIGTRPGLPDVLTGYAPNNFAFTSAEFGPASGPSLDPGGSLQHAFLDSELAAQLNELAALGASASLANDRSAKVVYISPKRDGFLAGVSYAPNAEDPRFDRLLQAGLVHERYWATNLLRLGGSATFAHGSRYSLSPQRSLRSINVGATLILDNDWMLGISGTWNGHTGLTGAATGAAANAYGTTASVNYNHGRWTAGAYYQWATSEGDPLVAGKDRLRATEAGVSYRLTTKLRFYGAVYSYEFDNEGSVRPGDQHNGTELLFGVRATL